MHHQYMSLLFQMISSHNTSFMSCLTSTDIRTDWLYVFPECTRRWNIDRKMQQPLKSINTSFISCLTTTDIRTDWFFAFSRLECWLCLNHKCALDDGILDMKTHHPFDDGILDKKMQRPLKPTTLFVGKLCRGAHWQCHCLAVIITIVIIIVIIIATSSA